jgi:hypothetical protein
MNKPVLRKKINQNKKLLVPIISKTFKRTCGFHERTSSWLVI